MLARQSPIRNPRSALFVAAVVGGILSAPAAAQSLKDRITAVRQQRAAERESDRDYQAARRTLAALQTPLADVDLQELTAREAVKWLADASGLDIVANWERMQEDGIDPDQQVQIAGGSLTPAAVLSLLARQIALDEPLIWEATPWYVELMTKNQANARTVVIIYPIQDLLHEVPNFTNAPQFDLQQITQQSGQQGFGGGQGGGSGGGGGGQGLFSDEGDRDDEDRPTTAERGEQIAQLIRDTIEPDIWRESGGGVGTIRYYNGNLIVRAPMYVHRQIGGAGSAHRGATGRASAGAGAGPGPGVSIDRRYVQLNMRASQANVTHIRQVPTSIGATGVRAGSAATAPSLRYTRHRRAAGIDR